MDGGKSNGSSGDLPWAAVFDPAANARALSAIQAEGFRAASELVDRFVRIATTGLGGAAPTPAAPASPAMPLTNDQRADLFGATNVEPLIRSWWSVVGQFLGGSAPGIPAAGPPAPPVPASLDFAADEAKGRLDLEAAVGGSASTVVWLHNLGTDDLGEIRLRCSELLSGDGGVLKSSAVQFDPAVIPMPGRSSRGIAMKIKVARNTAPGVYRGNMVVEGYPELWLPVVMTVCRSPA